MTHSTPVAVIERLASIEEDLANRLREYETAAGDRARLIRDWEKRLAIMRAKGKGSDADSRKQAAFALAAEQDDLYEKLTDAESRYEALRVVVRVLETRSAIGMSILKAQGRA